MTDPGRLKLQARRQWLRIELEISLGRFDWPSKEWVAGSTSDDVRADIPNSRFAMAISSNRVYIWDLYTGRHLLTERFKIGTPSQRLLYINEVYMMDTYLMVVKRPLGSDIPAEVECVNFASERPGSDNPDNQVSLTKYLHRVLPLARTEDEDVWTAFDSRRHQLRVCRYPNPSFWLQDDNRRQLACQFTCGSIEHFDASTVLAGDRHHSLQLEELGGYCQAAYRKFDLGLLIGQEAECHGAPGARLHIPREYEPLETIPRRRDPLERRGRRAQKLSCQFKFLDSVLEAGFQEAREAVPFGMSEGWQVIPRDGVWYLHVFDFRNCAPLFYFGGPDQQEIEWTINASNLLCFQDARGNAWLARRGRSGLKQFQHEASLISDNGSFWFRGSASFEGSRCLRCGERVPTFLFITLREMCYSCWNPVVVLNPISFVRFFCYDRLSARRPAVLSPRFQQLRVDHST